MTIASHPSSALIDPHPAAKQGAAVGDKAIAAGTRHANAPELIRIRLERIRRWLVHAF
jgi:hypothetical protein